MIEKILNDKQKYIVWDTETCNLNIAINNYAWQLGLIVCEGKNIVEEHLDYIKWDRLEKMISEDARRITRFDDKIYKEKAIDPKVVLDKLDSYLYNPEYLILFQNGIQFDSYVHNIWRKALNKKTDYSYFDRVIDTHAISKAYKLNIHYNRTDDFLVWQYKMLSIIQKNLKTNLTVMGKEAKIDFPYELVHEGLRDCQLLWLVWNRVLKPKLEGWLMLA